MSKEEEKKGRPKALIPSQMTEEWQVGTTKTQLRHLFYNKAASRAVSHKVGAALGEAGLLPQSPCS